MDKKELENINFTHLSYLSESKKKEIEARLKDRKEIERDDRPATDVYFKASYKDPETGVEVPTEEAVEQAKEWVDNQNQR